MHASDCFSRVHQPRYVAHHRMLDSHSPRSRPWAARECLSWMPVVRVGLHGLLVETQKALPLTYRGVKIDCAYRADLVVEGTVIVEVKSLESLAPIHSRQLLTYLRVADRPVGLLLNFGAATMREGHQAGHQWLPRVSAFEWSALRAAFVGVAGRRPAPLNALLCDLCRPCVENSVTAAPSVLRALRLPQRPVTIPSPSRAT